MERQAKVDIVRRFQNHGLVEGRDYTIGGLRTEKARDARPLIGLEMFGGFWRTYLAEESRKTKYAHWPSLLDAVEAVRRLHRE